jgi:hypothetical protein
MLWKSREGFSGAAIRFSTIVPGQSGSGRPFNSSDPLFGVEKSKRKEHRSRLPASERTLLFLRDEQRPFNGRWFWSGAGWTPLRVAGMVDRACQQPLRRSPAFAVGPLRHRWDGRSCSPAASSEVNGFCDWSFPVSWCSLRPDRVYLDGCSQRFDAASVALKRGERSLHEWSWI